LGVTEAELKAAIEAYDDTIKDARERRDKALAAAARAGIRPTDIVKITGYTREHVRRILRAQGVEAQPATRKEN
jgi:hypothetical protein